MTCTIPALLVALTTLFAQTSPDRFGFVYTVCDCDCLSGLAEKARAEEQWRAEVEDLIAACKALAEEGEG